MTVIIERDYRSEYLFNTRSVVTNMVTSLEFNPIRCATTLCHFGQTWIASVVNHSFLRCSVATSKATGNYVAVLEQFSQNEDTTSSIKERTRGKPTFVRKSKFNRCSEITCKSPTCINDFRSKCFIFIIDVFNNYFLLWENYSISCLYCFLLFFYGSWADKHFDVLFLPIRPVLFPSKDGKEAAYEWRDGWKGVLFPTTSAFFFVKFMNKVLFLFVPCLGV